MSPAPTTHVETVWRPVRFSATYEDGAEFSEVRSVRVPVTSDEDILREALWPHTGFGRPSSMSAVYNADSTDGRWPTICLEWA